MDALVLRAAALTAAAYAFAASAQPAAPPPPSFADANLSEQGVRAMAATCAACHGTAGRPVQGSALGPLAGRSREDLVQAMADFRQGKRPATLMHQIAKGYSDAEIAALAEHFSRQPR